MGLSSAAGLPVLCDPLGLGQLLDGYGGADMMGHGRQFF